MKAAFDRIVILLIGVALFLDGLALVDFLLHPLAPDYIFNSTIFRAVSILVLTPLTLLVGFLIIRRVPGNVVGPLLIVWSARVAYGSIRADIGVAPFVLFYYYDMVFGWLALFSLFLHFPDGKIYPSRAASWVYPLLGIILFLVNMTFLSTAILQVPSQMANPFYLPSLQKQVDLILRWAILFLSPILVMDVISPVLRYRKGSPLERQQIKWLALFASFSVIYVLLVLIAYPLLTGGEVMNPGENIFAMLFYLTMGLFPPVAIGVAVLRYRLWDVDILIRRTLLYSILTVILTLIYFGSVVVLQSTLTFIFHLESSNIVIVLSTLMTAILFTPLRRRIQSVIDRRFYRQRYDAEKVLAALNATLREEADLGRLTNSILEVVEGTMQPTHLSFWLREAQHPQTERQL